MNELGLRSIFLGIVGTSLLASACAGETDSSSAGDTLTGGDSGDGDTAVTPPNSDDNDAAVTLAPKSADGGAVKPTPTVAPTGTIAPPIDAAPTPVDAGVTPPPPVFDGGAFTIPICVDGQPALAAGLTPATPADYVAIRTAGDFTADVITESEHGTECGGASPTSNCVATLATAIPGPVTGGWNDCLQICSYYGIATTSGDNVALAQTRDEILATLGSIDSPEEAILMARVDGYSVWCDSADYGVRAVAGGYEVKATRMVSDCAPIINMGYLLLVAPDGTVTELQSWEVSRSNACVGRRPDGLVAAAPAAALSSLAHYFAETAHLEAASVDAFTSLARELFAHVAPPELVRLALEAASDEVRHASTTTALARRFGAEPRQPDVNATATRSLVDIACDNAREGCVRETFGALLATYQAKTAHDAAIAHSMAEIAGDETRHAELSWGIARWASAQLSDEEQARVLEARRDAIATLRHELSVEVDDELRRVAGVPSSRVAHALLDDLEAELWN